MTEQNHLCRVWDIIEKVGVCMLTTQFAGGLRARPIEARTDPDVGLVFIDPKDKAYLSITGRASVMRDAAKTEVVWRKTDEVWWPGGPTDPDVCLLLIEPLAAELWDGPASAAIAAFEFAKARLTGEEPKLGENRKVTVKM